MSGRKKYYWDSCVYLAWLQGESDKPQNALRHLVRECNEGKCSIITSTVTLIEVLQNKMDGEAERKFRDLFRFDVHNLYDVDIQIAMKARDLRSSFLDKGKPRPSCADAIHLATAIFYGADVFHTFDDGKKRDPSTGEKFSLLRHSGSSELDHLLIDIPSAPLIQGHMF